LNKLKILVDRRIIDGIENLIRDVPNFPKHGIIFKDITTLLKNPKGLSDAADELVNFLQDKHITKVAGIESRGFILGAIVAQKLGAGFVPIRKPGKLPAELSLRAIH